LFSVSRITKPLHERVAIGRQKLAELAAKYANPSLNLSATANQQPVTAEPQVPALDWLSLPDLCKELDRIESQTQALRERETEVRRRMLVIVRDEYAGQPVEVEGFGKLQITQDATVTTYDARQLDALIARLVADWPAIARAISDCRRESSRKGGLRVSREREREAQ
jgi:hypothetical protein